MEAMGRQAEVESRAWRPEVELEDYHTKAKLETKKPTADQSNWAGPPKEEPWGLRKPAEELDGVNREGGCGRLGGRLGAWQNQQRQRRLGAAWNQ